MVGERELAADMGKYVIGVAPDVLVSLGLGSCVGVAIWDPEKKVGGMAHIMLPTVEGCGKRDDPDFNVNKFADCAIPSMFEDLKKKGAEPGRMRAKIAGGAHMFATLSQAESLDIGRRNAESVKNELAKLNIPLRVNETGGNLGRTVKFYLETGKLVIKTKDGIQEF